MTNLIKYIYELGAKNENDRIRRLIAEFTLQSEDFYTDFDKYDTPPQSKAMQLQIRKKAQKILNELILPEWTKEFGTSPIDREKK